MIAIHTYRYYDVSLISTSKEQAAATAQGAFVCACSHAHPCIKGGRVLAQLFVFCFFLTVVGCVVVVVVIVCLSVDCFRLFAG